jgi:hypothetical protein
MNQPVISPKNFPKPALANAEYPPELDINFEN